MIAPQASSSVPETLESLQVVVIGAADVEVALVPVVGGRYFPSEVAAALGVLLDLEHMVELRWAAVVGDFGFGH